MRMTSRTGHAGSCQPPTVVPPTRHTQDPPLYRGLPRSRSACASASATADAADDAGQRSPRAAPPDAAVRASRGMGGR